MADVVMKTEVEVDPEIIDLVPLFLNARRKDVETLGELSRRANFEEMAKICHTIKGIARPYGFPSLEQLAVEMERECKSKNSVRTDELLGKMKEFVGLYRVS
jgi:HPt (histidine-containing phosphotransfer) domain-containing protein